MDFLVGGTAACMAVVFSNPLDVIKTRMLLQGELRAHGDHIRHYKNPFHAGYVISKNEGIHGLQKGLRVVLPLHMFENGIRLGMFQALHNNGYLTNSEGKTTFLKSLIASAVSGGIGAFFGSPFVMVKIHLQASSTSHIAVGYQHSHDGMVDAFRTIFKRFGVRGLWRGVQGTLLKSTMASCAQLTTFFLTKEFIETHPKLTDRPVLVSFLSSIVCGILLTIVIHPFDVVSCRLYNQGFSADGKGVSYSGIIDCFSKIKNTEGFFGFYKGFLVTYLRASVHTTLTLVFWERLKYFQRQYLENEKVN